MDRKLKGMSDAEWHAECARLRNEGTVEWGFRDNTPEVYPLVEQTYLMMAYGIDPQTGKKKWAVLDEYALHGLRFRLTNSYPALWDVSYRALCLVRVTDYEDVVGREMTVLELFDVRHQSEFPHYHVASAPDAEGLLHATWEWVAEQYGPEDDESGDDELYPLPVITKDDGPTAA